MTIPFLPTRTDGYQKVGLAKCLWAVLDPLHHLLTSLVWSFLSKHYFHPALIKIFFRNHLLKEVFPCLCFLRSSHSQVYTWVHLIQISFLILIFKRATVVWFLLPETNCQPCDYFLVFRYCYISVAKILGSTFLSFEITTY